MVTGKVRLSYPNIFKAKSFNGGDPKYSAALLIPKTDTRTLKMVKAAIEDAKQNSKDKWKGKVPANLRTPLRDGDVEREEHPEYAGHYFLNASATNQPKVYDRDHSEIIDPEEIYAGCYVRADISFFGYSASGNNGIGVGLNSIMKWADGERLSGYTASASAYDDDYEDDDDLI